MSFRDKSHLLTRLKQRLGIYSIKLPVDDVQLYKDVILDNTLPVFNDYFPYRRTMIADLNELRVVDRYTPDDSALISNEYQIPNLFPYQNIMYMIGIAPYIEYNGMMMTSSYETIDSYQVLATGQTLANLASTMIPPQTWQFEPPNRFRIFNQVLYNNKVWLEIAWEHSPELFTIPLDLREAFFKLAYLDMKIYLWSNLKYWSQMQTAIGTLDLKIDNYEGAEGDRDTLLEQWDDNYHLDALPAILYI